MTLPRLLVAVACTGALAACSGGGSSSPAGGGSTPTSPVATASASASGTTTFAVTSVPSGLSLSYSNGASTTLGSTPISLVPSLSNVAFAITIVPSNGKALFTFVGDQRNDGSHPVLYNQNADTSGSIGVISASAIARAMPTVDARARATIDRANARIPRVAPSRASGKPYESATRVVVRYREGALHDDLVTKRGARIGPVRAGVVTTVFAVPNTTTARAYAATLRSDPAVVSAEPDRLYYKQTTTAATPNDTHFDDYEQWSAFQIGAPNAWGYTEGDASISVAIVDTGLDFSQGDFGGSKVTYAESDVDGVTTVGAATAQDTDGHGTNVAGIAAADTNNGFGFAGIGFNTSLQIYKVFANDTAGNGYAASANASDVTLAIYSAVAHGARVINLSLGGCAAHGFDATQQAAIDDAIAANVVVVAAAGNERVGDSPDGLCDGASSTLDFPAAYDGVISVGATSLDDRANPGVRAGAREFVASYSNAGPGLSLVAPGGDPPADEADGSVAPDLLHWIDGLYATTVANPKGRCSNAADCRAIVAGTSQATPHVSGAAALLFAVNPQLSVAQIRTLLLANADDIGDPLEGSGRLDVYRALAALEHDASQPALPTAHDFVAFAYQANGSTTPAIVDVTYPHGVPVATSGTFRIADIPASASNYKIGLWYDANGDGVIDSGDYFGSSGSCNATTTCASAASIAVSRVP